MASIYEMDTWYGRKELNEIALAAAKKYAGRKFTVAIGQWGVTTYLVFTDTKEEAKRLAIEKFEAETKTKAEHVAARDVTSAKKYQ